VSYNSIMFTPNLMTNWSTGSKVRTEDMHTRAHSHTHMCTHTPQHSNLKSLLFHFWEDK